MNKETINETLRLLENKNLTRSECAEIIYKQLSQARQEVFTPIELALIIAGLNELDTIGMRTPMQYKESAVLELLAKVLKMEQKASRLAKVRGLNKVTVDECE